VRHRRGWAARGGTGHKEGPRVAITPKRSGLLGARVPRTSPLTVTRPPRGGRQRCPGPAGTLRPADSVLIPASGSLGEPRSPSPTVAPRLVFRSGPGRPGVRYGPVAS